MAALAWCFVRRVMRSCDDLAPTRVRVPRMHWQLVPFMYVSSRFLWSNRTTRGIRSGMKAQPDYRVGGE